MDFFWSETLIISFYNLVNKIYTSYTKDFLWYLFVIIFSSFVTDLFYFHIYL